MHQYWNFVHPSFFASQSSSFPILEIRPVIQLFRLIRPVFVCWKSASSSSPEFPAGNPFIASFPSVLAKSDLLSWKFGSLSSLTGSPSSLKTNYGLYGITYKVPSQTKRLTFLCWKSVCPSAHSSLPEIRLSFRSFFITGNPSVLPSALHCRKSVCSSAHSSLLEICLPFRPFFITGNSSVLPPNLYCRKSVRPSAHSSLPEIRLPFRSFFIAGNPSVLPPDLHYWKSVCPSA